MKRYIIERAIISLHVTVVTCIVPFLLAFLALGQNKGCILLLMVLSIAFIELSILMLPCIRFTTMICAQEKKGHSFESGEVVVLSKAMTRTYLGTEWLIYAGSIALHYTQCKIIRGVPNKFGRIRYSIIVETIDDRIYKWPLNRQKVKKVQDWLKQKNSVSA